MPSNSSVELEDFNILDYCNQSPDIRILESLYISKLMPSLNNSLSSHPLLPILHYQILDLSLLPNFTFSWYFIGSMILCTLFYQFAFIVSVMLDDGFDIQNV